MNDFENKININELKEILIKAHKGDYSIELKINGEYYEIIF